MERTKCAVDMYWRSGLAVIHSKHIILIAESVEGLATAEVVAKQSTTSALCSVSKFICRFSVINSIFLWTNLPLWKNLVPCEYNSISPLNAELNPICHVLALLGSHHIFHVSRIRVKKPKSPDRWTFKMLPSLVPNQKQMLFQQTIPRYAVSYFDFTLEWLMKNALKLW
jgi:hypothetical protein